MAAPLTDVNPLFALLGDPAAFRQPASRIPARVSKQSYGYGPHRAGLWRADQAPVSTRGAVEVAKTLQLMGVSLNDHDQSVGQPPSIDETLHQLDTLDIGLIEVFFCVEPYLFLCAKSAPLIALVLPPATDGYQPCCMLECPQTLPSPRT